MSPQIMETLLGRSLIAHQRALLINPQEGHFTRHPVRQQVYPGLVYHGKNDNEKAKTLSQSVEGVLFHDLSPQDMSRLDWYEESDYARKPARVQLLDGEPQEIETQTYVWISPLQLLDLEKEWSYQEFLDQHFDAYMLRTVQPCAMEIKRLGM